MRETRRNVLKTGGATLAALSGISGCLGLGGETATDQPDESGSDGGGDGGGDDGGESTPTATPTATPVASRPATAAADLTKWMPDPKAVEQTDSSGYAFFGMAPKALGAFEGDLGSGALEQQDEQVPISGVGTLGDQTAVYRFARSVSVIVGGFDRTAVEDGLREFGFETGEARHGFRVMTHPNPRAAAVRDGMLVLASRVSSEDTTDKQPLVERVVDARTDNGERYVDAVPQCSRLLDAIGSAHVFQGRTHGTGKTFEQGLGEGIGYHVAADQTRARAAALFTEGNADRTAMADWAGDAEALFGADPTVRADGQVVTATTLVPTGDVTEFAETFPGPAIESESPGAPQVSFAFDYESTGDGVGRLTITHEGGDTVARDALFLRGNGFATVDGADQTEPGPWQGSASSDGDGVVAGDSVTVGVTSEYVLNVVWEPSDGDSSATLAVNEGPDA